MLCADYSTKLNDIAKIPLPAFDAWTPNLTESMCHRMTLARFTYKPKLKNERNKKIHIHQFNGPFIRNEGNVVHIPTH